MFQWFWRLLYESTPAEFRSAFGLAQTVERLRAATGRSVFSSLGKTAAVGWHLVAAAVGVVGVISPHRRVPSWPADHHAPASRHRAADRVSSSLRSVRDRHQRDLGPVVACAAEAFRVGATVTRIRVPAT
jgi:hypothetical protein